MKLDLARLENVMKRIGKTIARCPACAEQGHDEKGDHLAIYPDGKFACVAHRGETGHAHRKRIIALVGDPGSRQCRTSWVRVHRPAHKRLPKIAGTEIDLGQFGTLGTGYFNPYATREKVCECKNEMHTHIDDTHTLRSGKRASQASQPVQIPFRQIPLDCGDPLIARALAAFNSPR
jgi:hypothetical protein